ncbi:MAG: haloacid dehalogenase, partial [Parabacteroides sp.]|nr:haloacid dehalogenase [Parabacteroides sp.]
MNEKYKAKELIEHSMMGNLGIEILPEENGVVRARMPVNDRTSQPFGLLCGGASLAFAEILAGYGSFLYCQENQIPVGSSVFGNHISSVK